MYKLLTVLLALTALNATAAQRMGKSTSEAYFKIDGQKATAMEADAAAKDHTIEQCKPIKNSEPPASKCSEVVKEYNPKTGSPTWKRP